ncbi:MAG: hypothetical protein JNM02_00050 [Anaerolineales bacterium]|nr:hypothetical protein [Anaerolineales bacterium]
MNENQLKGYFAFDDSDLNANRNGRLSEKQVKRFKEVDQFAHRFVLGLFLVFLAVTLFLGYRAISEMTSIGLWVGTVIMLLVTGWAFRGVRTDVDNSVEKTEGEVQFVKVEKQTGSATDPSSSRTTVSSYEMRVGGVAFGNANPALIDIMQGEVYSVYYTKTTRQILSVEFVSKGK